MVHRALEHARDVGGCPAERPELRIHKHTQTDPKQQDLTNSQLAALHAKLGVTVAEGAISHLKQGEAS